MYHLEIHKSLPSMKIDRKLLLIVVYACYFYCCCFLFFVQPSLGAVVSDSDNRFINFDTAEEAVDYYESQRRERQLQTKKQMSRRQLPAKHWSEIVDENGNAVANSAEQALYQKLLGKRYLKHVRPVRNHSQPIVVKVGMCVMMIEDLIERDQIMIMASCVKMSWVDEYLKWDPDMFDNVTWMAISSEKIWLPDIAIVNSPEPHSLTRKITNLDLNYRGEVGYFPSGRLATRCNLVITYFPFDWQHCEVRFESWIYPTKYLEIHLYPGDEAVDLKEYYVNFQWTIKGYEIKPEVVDYDGKNFSSITFTFTLRRKPAFYFMYFIFPELLLALLQTLSHTLPVEHPGRMTMLTALFIGTTVTHAGIASHIPKSSDTMSLLQVYMSIMSINLVVALIVTFVMLYTVLRYPNAEPGFNEMMIAFFSIVWPSKPNRRCPSNRQKLSRVPVQFLPSLLPSDELENGSDIVGNNAVTHKSSSMSFKGKQRRSNGGRHSSANRGIARDLSDLYLNRNSSAATGSTGGDDGSSTMSGDDCTPCCGDEHLHFNNNNNNKHGLFVKRRHSNQNNVHQSLMTASTSMQTSTAGGGYEVLIRNASDGYVAYTPNGQISSTISRRSSCGAESAGGGCAESQFMSTQHCLAQEPMLSNGAQQQQVPRIIYNVGGDDDEEADSTASLGRNKQLNSSSATVLRNGNVQVRYRRPNTLFVPNALSVEQDSSDAMMAANQRHHHQHHHHHHHSNNSNQQSYNRRYSLANNNDLYGEGGTPRNHRRFAGGSDEHDLKRRWLIYCVALDKSIMYANLIWNVTIPIALFFVVPYLHEMMLSPEMATTFPKVQTP